MNRLESPALQFQYRRYQRYRVLVNMYVRTCLYSLIVDEVHSNPHVNVSVRATPPWCLRQNRPSPSPASSRSSDIQRRRNLSSHHSFLRLDSYAPWREITLARSLNHLSGLLINPLPLLTRPITASINAHLSAIRYPR